MVTLIAVETDEQRAKLMQLIQVIWPETYSPIIGQAQVTYMLETFQSDVQIRKEQTEGVLYYLVEIAGQVIGYTAYESIEEALYLSKLYIKKDQRGNGYAKKVFNWYEVLAIQLGKKYLKLRVNKQNKDAVNIYQHQGFEIIKEDKLAIGNGYYMDDYIMKKNLAL